MSRLSVLVSLLMVVACSGSSTPPGSPGTPCTQDSDCSTGLSCAQTIDFPTAVCAQSCGAVGAACPEHDACTALQSGQVCLQQCVLDVDCPRGWVCRGPADSLDLVCMEQASVPGSCPYLPHLVVGDVAGPATEPSGCRKPVVESALPSDRVQRLGVHPVNDVVTFDVPDDTRGLSIVEQAVDAGETITYLGYVLDNAAVPLEIRGPSGEVLYDDYDAGGPPERQYIYVGSPTPVENTVGVTNTSPSLQDVEANGGLPSGTWSLVVNDWANECATINASSPDAGCDGGSIRGVYDVTVVTQPTAGANRIDLDLYLVNEGLLSAARAVTDPNVVRMVRSLAELYAQNGLCIGTVTLHEVPEWARAKYATVSADETTPCSDLFQLFTLSEPGNSLHVFLVESITSELGGGYSVVGLDGTVPGPSSFGGSVFSGAVVSSADLAGVQRACGKTRNYIGCGPDFVGYVAAHEAGHWLGLFHTTEATGDFFDPLQDTPTCACSACAPTDERAACGGLPDGGITFVTGATCASGQSTCSGSDNLMFWLLDLKATGHLTDEQVRVMRSNVVVQ